MTTAVDLVVYGARQLLTLAGKGTRRGAASGELGLVADGAVAISAGQIVAVGTTSEVLQSYRAPREIDAGGRVVLPGFIDAHTHPVFAGSRQDEFERRIAGATYLEIMAAGGGIMSTVRATRQASLEQLVGDALPRLRRMLAHGTTTADAKTGYGLTTADELKCLETIRILGKRQPIELLPTFLGAHAVPEEHAGRADAYVELVVEEMLPAAAEQHARSAGHEASAWQPLACDVFCDEGAFNLEQTRRILVAAKDLGMTLKLHADEFASLGAARLAAELGAVSADHLLKTPADEITAMADAGMVGVLLPGTPFGLGLSDYADARGMVSAGLPVALGTDLNPGTCYCESMPFIIALACRFMHLSPAEAIVASTVNAAFAIGRSGDLGRLQPGYAADLLVLDVDDYRHLAYRFGSSLVQMVVKRGEIVFQARDSLTQTQSRKGDHDQQSAN